MIKYLTLQYKMGKIDDTYLAQLVELGRITEEDVIIIKGE